MPLVRQAGGRGRCSWASPPSRCTPSWTASSRSWTANDRPRQRARNARGLETVRRARRCSTALDLALPAGSVVGLLGKNGAGKTTLCARAGAGPRRSWHGGDARRAGLELERQRQASTWATCRKSPQLYPWMQVRHILDYIGSFYQHWNRSLVERLVREWDLPPTRRAGTLSVGELQKLALVVAPGARARTVGAGRAGGQSRPGGPPRVSERRARHRRRRPAQRAVLHPHHLGPGTRRRSRRHPAARANHLLRRAG